MFENLFLLALVVNAYLLWDLSKALRAYRKERWDNDGK